MNRVIIEVCGSSNKFINKCIQNNINIKDINYIDDDNLNANIDISDFKRLKKACYFCKIKIIKYEGFNGIKLHLRNNIYVYLLFLWCFILMDILSSYIVKINVIHENSKIRNLVMDELDSHGIRKYTLAFSFDELEKIKNEILDDNPNTLEWMSITRVGMSYVIRVEERIIKKDIVNDLPRNIIAGKDALITKVISSKGEVMVRSNDYVKKGDILISGEIKLYDEIKSLVAASGSVYGKVWYEADAIIPLFEERKLDTNRSRYNISFNNKVLLKNKYPLFRLDRIREINILGLKIKIYKELEYVKEVHKYSSLEMDNLVSQKIEESFSKKLNGDGRIISQKVLKKEEKKSTIEYRVFVVTNELISKYENIELRDDNDSGKST